MKRTLVPIEINGILLRPLQYEDLPTTLEWRNKENVRCWFKNAGIVPLKDHLQWFSRYSHRDDDFTFMGTMNGRPMAQVAVYNVNFESLDAEVGRFIVNPSFQGMGYMKSACEALLDLCSTQLGLKQVYLEVFKKNIRGISLYKNLGFVEGVHDGDFMRMMKNI